MKTIGQIINETLPTAADIILKESHIEITEKSDVEIDYDRATTIGFSGEKYQHRGTLGFAAEKSILEAEYGENNRRLSDGWLGEIANQLLGRLKNVLLASGVEIHLQIPKVLHNINITVFCRVKKTVQFTYNSQFGHCSVWVDANWDLSQELQEAECDEHAQPEGEMIMF